jgi:ABC-type Fe3+/spermidine/putrescine transport system ATPase subunit
LSAGPTLAPQWTRAWFRPASGSASATGPAGAALSLSGLTHRYGAAAAPAVDRLDLDLAPGEFLTLLGTSGSGKTTTLMMVAGFTAPDAGAVLLDGRPIHRLPPERRGIGVVFQNYALFPHMTAVRNVAFPLRMRGVGRGEARMRAEAALERVGLAGLGHRLPGQLSGGQQQRVALARALVFEPGLLLMDEPLGALDRALRERMKDEIRRLHRDLGITVLYVTHDQEEALTLSDRVALMHRGRIVQVGSPADLYERPASRFVAASIGAGVLIPGRAGRAADGGPALVPAGGPPLPAREGGPSEGAPAVLLLRPEKVVVEPAGAPGLPAVAEETVYVGDVIRAMLRLTPGGVLLSALLPNRAGMFRPARGEAVAVRWNREDAVLLSPGEETTTHNEGGPTP